MFDEKSSDASPTEQADYEVTQDVGVDGGPTALWQAHQTRTCHPCFFFTRKGDGCRKGAGCPFCHFCTRKEATQRRNYLQWQRKKALRQANQGEVDASDV